MSQIVPHTAQVLSHPTPTPPNMAKAVSFWLTKLEPPGSGKEIMACNAPSDEQRDGLKRRAIAIDAWSRPALIERIEEWVGGLIGTIGWQGGSEDDTALTMGVYVTALRDLPGYAVEAACKAFLQGRVPGQNRKVRPSPPEIAAEAERQAYALSRERRQIDLVLNAKVVETKVDPARRAAAVALARETAAAIRLGGIQAEAHRAGQAFEPPPPPEAPEQVLERLRAEAGKPLAPLSAEALRTFGIETNGTEDAA